MQKQPPTVHIHIGSLTIIHPQAGEAPRKASGERILSALVALLELAKRVWPWAS
ncbi:hypothetical protein [Solimonas fluminis]|uniref:hypothetical protein n=1 Tax=Solimonas fluminis TaxID=2086571 RepID=UPI0013FDAA9F|nr:hypothetical protein [Solimonas fluminis]